MKFEKTGLDGVWTVDLLRYEDERGFFATSYAAEEFAKRGIRFEISQSSISSNIERGTLRGLHFQLAPKAQAKFVTCLKGKMFDVVVDLREDSPNYLRWVGVELDSESYRSVYIPEGFAHGYQTLSDNAVIYYHMGAPYAPELGRGMRWDDPAVKVKWPLPVTRISERDRSYPDWIARRS